MAQAEHQTDEPLLFEALISPNRSLSRRGRALLFVILASAGVITAIRFWLLGAWPVAAFVAIEIGLATLLFWLHARNQQQTERLLLSQTSLRLIHTASDGRRRQTQLPLRWLSVELEERSGRVPALLVRCRGDRMEILQKEVAAVLGDTEKRELAAALRQAVDRLHNPVFDNHQLRLDADQASTGPIDLIRSNTRLRTDGSVIR